MTEFVSGGGATVRQVIERSTEAIDALERLGAEIEDEWQYVTDLAEAYRAHLAEVTAGRGEEPVTVEVARAVALAIEEAGLVTDPHRAIDWLSTFPQIVLFTLGAEP